jgi:hypothetical protein
VNLRLYALLRSGRGYPLHRNDNIAFLTLHFLGPPPTPRLNPHLAWHMMRVGKADINLRHLVDQIKARKMPRRSRAPNCTHLDMDRVYGRNQHCDVCGRSPPIGFLYECRQDWVTQSLCDLLTKDVEKGVLEVVKSDMRLELECLGLSESVILTAEQGHYTISQLEKIKTQKKELRQIISDSLQASQINDAAATLAVLAQAPSNHDGAQNSTPEKEAVSQVPNISLSGFRTPKKPGQT